MRAMLSLLAMLVMTSCDRPAAPSPPAPTPAAAPAPSIGTYFQIPGDYGQATTAAGLQARFGENHTRVVEDPERALMLFPDDPSRRARVTFHDSDKLEDLASIEVSDPGSRWRGKHGVQIGMSLTQLRALNGKPFYFYTALDGASARVHDTWSPALEGDGGSLGRFDVDEGEHAYFEVELGARDPAALPRPFAPEEQMSSDDPHLAGKGESIVVIRFGGTTSLDDEWD